MNKATALEIVRRCCDSVACDKPTRDKIEAALAVLVALRDDQPTDDHPPPPASAP